MSRVAAKLAVRPSRRPNIRSTTRRPTWVETKRSVVERNVPTFSARECRSAAEEALGAKGSCTCTKSSSVRSSSSSSVRDTSSGSETEPPRRKGSDWPTATMEAQPGSSNTASGSEASRAKVERLLAEAAADGVRLAVLPETYLSLYPSNAWAHQASTFGGSDELWERMWDSSVEVPGPVVDRLAGGWRQPEAGCPVGGEERGARRPGA